MIGDYQEILRLKSRIADPAAPKDDILDVLSVLSEFTVDKELITQTRIGVGVGRLRKHTDPDVAKKSSELVEKWRSVAKATQVKPSEEASSADDNSRVTEKQAQPDTNESNLGNDQGHRNVAESSQVDPDSYLGPLCDDEKRNQARQTLYKAFGEGVPAEELSSLDALALARVIAAVEDACHAKHVEADGQKKNYIQQVRALKSNLKDPKNPEFKFRVYMGALSPDELAVMESLAMASDAKKIDRQKKRKDALEACQSDWDFRNIKMAPGQFPCRKCKSEQTTCFQLQTRSADEPMTTFVTCLECGNRWKF